MRFVIRDDDLNFFYDADRVYASWADVWDTCPVSIAAIPFVRSDWVSDVEYARVRGPGGLPPTAHAARARGGAYRPLGENTEIVALLRSAIASGHVRVGSHGIHHVNGDPTLPELQSNYALGAEFWTSRDLTSDLADAVAYLSETLQQPVDFFTPPQNAINARGLRAVVANGLGVCADLPSPRKFNTLMQFGLRPYIAYAAFKGMNRGYTYPHPIAHGSLRIVGHHRLQPGTDCDHLLSELRRVHAEGGVFVLSTHMHAFDAVMSHTRSTMGDALRSILEVAVGLPGVEFCTLSDVLSSG